MFRFLGLLAATAALSATVVSASYCHDKAEALRNCVMTIPEPDYETEAGQMAFQGAMRGCCEVSANYTAYCGEENAFIRTWRSWNTTMTDQQWNTAIQLLGNCPRYSESDCVGKLTSVATCIQDGHPVADCCTPAMNSGRCHAYELESLWDLVDPIYGLDRASLEGPVGDVFDHCPSFTDFDCGLAIDTLLETIDGLPEDAEYPRDVSKRCTAASAVSHICKGQGDYMATRLSTTSESTRGHFHKQLDACDVTRDEDDGPPGECGEPIPGAYLYHEGAIAYLAMETCPPATDPTTSPAGVLCDPVYGPVSGTPMFYKVGYFNPATMMETPPDCLPPVDPMP
jgi:hypothetical protein